MSLYDNKMLIYFGDICGILDLMTKLNMNDNAYVKVTANILQHVTEVKVNSQK